MASCPLTSSGMSRRRVMSRPDAMFARLKPSTRPARVLDIQSGRTGRCVARRSARSAVASAMGEGSCIGQQGEHQHQRGAEEEAGGEPLHLLDERPPGDGQQEDAGGAGGPARPGPSPQPLVGRGRVDTEAGEGGAGQAEGREYGHGRDQNAMVVETLKVRGAPGITKPSLKVPIQYFLSATFSTLALKRTGVLPKRVA